jgi:formate/nitrite transporter FocA (FNT family)
LRIDVGNGAASGAFLRLRQGRQVTMGRAERIKKEVRELLVAAVFFSTGLCLVILAGRLMLLVDMLPFIHAFPNKPLAHNVLWKSTLYVAGSLVVRYVEPVLKSLFHGVGMAAAQNRALEEFTTPRFWASEIWIAILLIIFATIRELDSYLGEGKLRLMFFGR